MTFYFLAKIMGSMWKEIMNTDMCKTKKCESK